MANGEWRIRMANGKWRIRMANGDGGIGVVVADGTAKNCAIDERFSYSRFNAGKQGATRVAHQI